TRLGAFGLVLHLGSHLGAGFDGVVKKVAAELLRALERASATLGATSCPILLENSAGAGGTLGRSFLELGAVIEAAGADERLGACLDTQHLYASGVSFGSIKEADSVVAGLDSAIGLERLACLHLNDSKVPCGANSDRHENLGEGFIGRQALGTLLAHPRLQHVPAVLEVPGREKKGPGAGDLAVARAIHAAGLRRRRYWLATRRPPPGPRQEPGARRGSRPNRSP
ncbi:MAG: deoxyribonuclease IV, partial [Acidimicrobiales bacterium]